MMYEPGFMDEGMKGRDIVREDLYIDPREPGKMISKTDWMQLDDGDEGIAVDRVDWTGCEFLKKQSLIEIYNMRYIRGYQPEAPKTIAICDDPYVMIVNGKAQANKNSKISNTTGIMVFLATFCISYLLFLYFAVDALERPIALAFGSLVVTVIASCVTIPVWKWGIEVPIRVRKQQRLYNKGLLKSQFNEFIKGCRK
jgi:hypothetical protein